MSDLELLTAKEVCGLLKLGRTTLWRWVKAGTFPAPRSIGPNCTRWLQSEVAEWLANAQLTMSADLEGTGQDGTKHENSNKITPYHKARHGENRPETS